MTKADSEVAFYLGFLLKHASECQAENCTTCCALHGIVELVQNRMFTSAVFPASQTHYRECAALTGLLGPSRPTAA